MSFEIGVPILRCRWWVWLCIWLSSSVTMWFLASWLLSFLLYAPVVIACIYIVQIVRILMSDCDLTLKFYQRWGRNPSSALRGKVVWITGASSGIGEYLAYKLAKCGAKLILSATREKELRRVLEKCKSWSPPEYRDCHLVLPLNLLETFKHSDYAVKVLEEFGRIDFLVNNAGRSQRAVVTETKLEVDKAVLQLNTIGTISLTKTVLPHLVEQKDGCIVVINSVAGKMGSPGSASYCTSKHALQGFFDTLRMEVADSGISVISVCPGPIDTPFRQNLFGTELQREPSIHRKSSVATKEEPKRMTKARCAELIAVAMANKIDEVWMSRHPVLLFAYISQYLPVFAKWMGKRIGSRRSKAVQAGLDDIDSDFFKKS